METRPSGRRTHHPTQAHMWGDSRRQWETSEDKGRQDPREGGHTIQHRHTCGETVGEDSGRRQWEKTVGDKETRPLGRRTNQAHIWGDSGRQGETVGDKGRQDPREGGHTIQYRHICGETVGDSGRQGETRGDKGRQGDTRGDKTLGKGRQGETRPSGRAHHPTQAHMWGDSTVGDSGRQGEEELCKMSAPPNRRRTETGTKRCQPHKPATPQREVAGNQAKQFKVHQQDEGD